MPSCMGRILSASRLDSLRPDADRGRHPRDLRDHRRPGEEDDLRGALPARAPRRAQLPPDHRVARNNWDRDELEGHARESIEAKVSDPDEEAIKRLDERLDYVQGEFDEDELYKRLAEAMGEYEQAVFYLEIPPSLFGDRRQAASTTPGSPKDARVVFEKPFGHDRESAQALNAELCEVLTRIRSTGSTTSSARSR